jgi:septum formation protein
VRRSVGVTGAGAPEDEGASEVLLLASASPQRRAILAQIGIAFTVEATDVAERAAGDPRAVAAENARRKALAPVAPGRLVLGADTVVAVDGQPLGKPRDEDHAREYLGRLSGIEHEVCGGIALVRDGRVAHEAMVVTRVAFRALTAAAVEWYVATGEWRERAGGYAIQGAGAALCARIHGDYLNIVGLSLATLLELAPELWPPPRS